IFKAKIGDGAAEDASERVCQKQSLLLYLRGRGVSVAFGDRTIRRRVHDVRLGLSALGYRMAEHRKARRRAERHLTADERKNSREKRARVLSIRLAPSGKSVTAQWSI